MSNARRQHVAEDLGFEAERAEDAADMRREEARRVSVYERRQSMEACPSYRLVRGIATVMDGYFLDPVIGFALPGGIGDALAALFTIPSYYVAIFKLKSLPLVLAITFNTLVDVVLGAIPFFVGDLLDVFVHSYRKNYALIVGYVEDDKKVISSVRKKAFWMFLGIVLFSYLSYKLVSLAIGWLGALWTWLMSLFA